MYKEFNRREWSSEDLYLKYKYNSKKIFKSSLALEDYADHTGNDKIYNDPSFKILREYYSIDKNKLTEKELIEYVIRLADSFDELFNKIGLEKFTFYEDGGVEYNWNK